MNDYADFNQAIIDEFRANGGRVGGGFAGAPMIVVHHVGRKSGEQRTNPMMYRPDSENPDTVYVFASAAGSPKNPAWYYNLTNAGSATIELGPLGDADTGIQTYDVDVRDVTGAERDEIYAAQARDYPGFADYATKTEGIRTIPVLALTRR